MIIRSKYFIAGLVCLCLGFIMFGYSIVHKMIVVNTLTLSQGEANQLEGKRTPTSLALPNGISVEGLIDVAVEPLLIVNKKWAVSERMASYVTQSARPGE